MLDVSDQVTDRLIPARDIVRCALLHRALLAAQESEDALALSCAVWFLAQAHRDAGDFDAARAVNRQGMEAASADLDDASPELRAMWGALEPQGKGVGRLRW